MRFLKTNTATRVTVGPFLDKADGVTPETGLTVTSCKLTLMVDDGGVPTLVLDTNPTASGGNNDMVHVTGDDAGFYDLELTAANLNYVGRAMLALTDAATHCPVFHEFMILPANIYDSIVGGSDVLDVSVTQWLGTAAATPTVAGVPEVDVTHIGGTAVTAAAGIPEVKVASVATGAITAGAIAADAIGASELAADAVTEIQSGLATAAELAKVPKSDGTASWNATALAAIQSEANDALVAYDPPTKAELDSAVAPLALEATLGTPADTDLATDIANIDGKIGLPDSSLAADVASIASGVNNQFVAGYGATIGDTGNDTTHVHLPDLTFGDDEINDLLLLIFDDSAVESHIRWIEDWVAATKLATVAALPFTPQNSTDTYWILAKRRDTAPTGASIRSAVGLASANLDTQLAAIDDAIDTEVAAILTDTNELQTDWTNGGRLDLLIDAIKAKTDNLPASPAATGDIPSAATIADAVWDEAATGHTDAGKAGEQLWTDLDAVLVDTGTTLQGELDGIQADTEDIQSRLPAALVSGRIDASVGAMAADVLTAAATASSFGTEIATAVWASATRTLSALGFTLGASDLAADTIGASELAADAITEIVNAVLTTAMTESYNTDGAAPTLAQALFLCMQRLTEFAISGTTITVKKLDGSTTAYTLTLDDADSPTSSTRAS